MKGKKPIKWRAIIGFIMIVIATILDQNWIWGLFFLYWILPDLALGRTYFLEEIARHENPILYFLIMGTLLLLSVYILIEPLLT